LAGKRMKSHAESTLPLHANRMTRVRRAAPVDSAQMNRN
jgi:hypothetical protein